MHLCRSKSTPGPVFNHLYFNRRCQQVSGSTNTTAGPGGESAHARFSLEVGLLRCFPSEERHQLRTSPFMRAQNGCSLKYMTLGRGPLSRSRFLTGCTIHGQVGFDLWHWFSTLPHELKRNDAMSLPRRIKSVFGEVGSGPELGGESLLHHRLSAVHGAGVGNRGVY